MSNYGISTDSLPMFLGNECVIEHFKTFRLQYRHIHRDYNLQIDSTTNNLKERNQIIENKGWYDISLQKVPLDDLFVFVGVQSLYRNGMAVPLKVVKFRHHQGKTQARIAIQTQVYMNSDVNFSGLDNYVEIFIYRRLTHIEPNKGYGIHIYDGAGNLRYKDGLNLLNNIRSLPIYFNKASVSDKVKMIFEPNRNPQLKNMGGNIAVLQTTHYMLTVCQKTGQHWNYSGYLYTAFLNKSGDIEIRTYESSMIFAAKKHAYPSYAKGGEYVDNIMCTNHLLVIDKPT